MDLPPSVQHIVEGVARDRVSGATEIAKRTAVTLLEFIDGHPNVRVLPELICETARALARAQPTMAPVLNLANTMLLAAGTEERGVREQLRCVLSEFARTLESNTNRVLAHAMKLFRSNAVLLTHSNSTVVRNLLLELRKGGNSFSVICTESRPMNEGVALARELASKGIAVTLVTDAAVFSVLPRASCVLLGADSVSVRGIVNKAGTSGIALAAASLKIPVYVLCSSEKFIPDDLIFIDSQDSAEVLPEEIHNLTAHNASFDVTPIDHITGIVTENGFSSSGEIREHLASLRPLILSASDLRPPS